MAIIRWTTPTFEFSFGEDIDVSDIDTAYLVLKQWGNTIVSKDITEADIDTDANSISWTLTQAETGLVVTAKKCDVMMDWLLDDGTRGRSDVASYSVEDSGINEVISNE